MDSPILIGYAGGLGQLRLSYVPLGAPKGAAFLLDRPKPVWTVEFMALDPETNEYVHDTYRPPVLLNSASAAWLVAQKEVGWL